MPGPRPSKNKTTILLLLLALAHSLGGTPAFLPGTSFHKATWGEKYGALESTATPDEGGLLYLFLENIEEDTIIEEIQIRGVAGHPQPFDGWYTTPDLRKRGENTSANVVTLFVKGIGPPLAEGRQIEIVVRFRNGGELVKKIPELRTPPLRIANMLPSPDNEALFVYLRNDGDQSVDLREMHVNRNRYDFGESNAALQVTGGGRVAPGAVEILRIDDDLDLRANATMAIRLRAENAVGDSFWTSAGVRIVPAVFHLGSWHSSAADPGERNEEGRKRLRRIGVDLLQGPGNAEMIARMSRDYPIGIIREAPYGDPFDPKHAAEYVREHDGMEGFTYWTIDDEPDLFGKPIGRQLKKASLYREHAPQTPIHTNLAVQKKFQRYGWYADIVSMDHYAAPDAPNVIPKTWIPVVGRRAEIAEAVEYTDQLKRNTEPRRNWSWVQLAANVWDVQPDPVAIDYQFWAHVSGGAKTLKYFVAKPDTQEDYPEQWETSVRLFHTFKQIRNLALYGEPAPGIAKADHPSARARALVGPDAVVVTVLNESIRFKGNRLTGYRTEWDEFEYEVELQLPSWIQQEAVYRVTADGMSVDVELTHVSDNRYNLRVSEKLGKRSHVFVIGAEDDQPPDPVGNLRVVDHRDNGQYTLSWAEPWDNTGVSHYEIWRNGKEHALTKAPIWEVSGGPEPKAADWRIIPVDSAGNRPMRQESTSESPIGDDQPSSKARM